MRYVASFLLIVALSIGCSWSPSRDNPIDPKSSNYIAPPPPIQPNRAPVIDTIFIVTDCHKYIVTSDFCSFEVHARIHDLDGNLRFDSVSASIALESETVNLGLMSYDPTEMNFYVRHSQNEFPQQTLSSLIRKPVTVRAVDDSGAVGSDYLFFPTPNTNFAAILHPDFYESVNTRHPQLGWHPWDPSLNNYQYSISLLYKNIYSVWDTAGLPASDTAVVVTPALESAETDPQLWYFWFLTVRDHDGNRMTSAPGSFQVNLPRTMDDATSPKQDKTTAGLAEVNR